MKKTIFLSESIEVLIISFGGVGTTFLIEELSKYKHTNANDNSDGYKHLIVPPIGNPNVKVIYLFGDPVVSTVSLFRRNYHSSHSHMIQKYLKSKVNLPIDTSLKEYAEKSIDAFRFEKHFNNWYEKFRMYDTMFLRYDAVHTHLKEILEFLDLPNEFVISFPKRKQRKSSVDEIENSTLVSLNNMYSNILKKLNSIPDYEIKTRMKISILTLLGSNIYRRALVYAFFQKFTILRKLRNKLLKTE